MAQLWFVYIKLKRRISPGHRNTITLSMFTNTQNLAGLQRSAKKSQTF